MLQLHFNQSERSHDQKMSFFDGEACPDDNLKGILSIHLKLGKYIRSIKIWKSLDFGIDWLRNGRVIND